MASRAGGAAGLALGSAVRAGLIGVLAFCAMIAASHHLYATALVLVALLAVVALDLVRAISAADRALAQFIDGLTAEGYERPRPPRGLEAFAQAMGRAQARLASARAAREQKIDFLEALIDTVAAALLVVDEGGQVVRVNRAAHLHLRAGVGPLAGIGALSREAVERLLAAPAGTREIVRLADNRAALVQVASFAAPGEPRRRLIALQIVAADLDAVELKAWQDLVRVLAHEMMNSLTPVCSLSESLSTRIRQVAPDQPQALAELAEAVDVIARRSTGLMHFVERYRRLTDAPSVVKDKVAMTELVGRLDRLLAPMIAEAGVGYSSRVEPRRLTLRADPDLLEQAIINLLLNAIDAARGQPGGMVRLTCELADDQVAIAVEDNGPGLPTDDPEAVFVPFFTTKAGGSGVGLTLSRQIALAHGGRIEHQRLAPRGAAFRLVLPIG